jgi:2-phosphoglycerate kinase
MARALMSAGIPPARAYELARLIEVKLAGRDPSLEAIQEATGEILSAEGLSDVVEHLAQLDLLEKLELPLIVLIGGAPGSGKSMVSAELAHRLGVTHVTATDVVRQTIRAFFSEEVMPIIHPSSFEAFRRLHSPVGIADPVLVGFLEQARQVGIGVRAVVERAVAEHYWLIVEGVHLLPGELEPPAEAIVCEFLLAVSDPDEHRERFRLRELASAGARRQERYLEHFAQIRRIQDYLLERARSAGTPVIEESDGDETVLRVLRLVLRAVSDRLALEREDAPASRELPARWPLPVRIR